MRLGVEYQKIKVELNKMSTFLKKVELTEVAPESLDDILSAIAGTYGRLITASSVGDKKKISDQSLVLAALAAKANDLYGSPEPVAVPNALEGLA
jgi:hypothetical protein